MKVSDYIINFFIEKGIKHVFGYPGGMVTDIMESLDKNRDKIQGHISYHEQGAAFAACGMAQITHEPGVCYATSGPGATNLITGIANSYFDSIPCIFITGQVNTKEGRAKLECRQRGFQETDIISIVKPITKYSKKIENALEIRYELEKAYYYSKNDRPGAVLLDIPIDIQKQNVKIEKLETFSEPEKKMIEPNIIEYIYNELEGSKRPVIIAGNGINIANCKKEFRELINKLKIPVVTSMIAIDCIPSESYYNYGFIGAYGNRFSNIIVEKSDCIISMGSRLDVRQTGPKNLFAQNAKLIRIDVDSEELTNVIKNDEIQIKGDLKEIINLMLQKNMYRDFSDWNKHCVEIKNELQDIDKNEYCELLKEINLYAPEDCILTTDVGQNQVWIAQYWKVKEQQRILFSGGLGAMGYSLPSSIGAYYANPTKKIFSISGDGGFQMNIQELQFIFREKLPIKIIVINNYSLGMIRHFQEMYFNANYVQTMQNNGYLTPDFCKLAKAYGIRSYKIKKKEDLEKIKEILDDDKSVLIELDFPQITSVYPKLAVGKPVYDQEPLIDREKLKKLLKDKVI